MMADLVSRALLAAIDQNPEDLAEATMSMGATELLVLERAAGHLAWACRYELVQRMEDAERDRDKAADPPASG